MCANTAGRGAESGASLRSETRDTTTLETALREGREKGSGGGRARAQQRIERAIPDVGKISKINNSKGKYLSDEKN